MPPRTLTDDERDQLLGQDLIARLATIGEHGYPHVTPIWFHRDGTTIRMTSIRTKPHVARIESDQRVCVLVDDEDPERADGERPNRQVRMIGDATVTDDDDGWWTREITRRYLTGPGAAATAERRAANDRVVIALTPSHTTSAGSVVPYRDNEDTA